MYQEMIRLASNLVKRAQYENVEIDFGAINLGKHYNPRLFRGSIVELAKLIETSQWLSPLLVENRAGEYWLIQGTRRFAAITYIRDCDRKAGRQPRWQNVPVTVYSQSSKLKTFRLAAVENMGRRELNPYEKAILFKEMGARFDFGDAQIADELGVSRSQVSNHLRILKRINPQIEKAMANGVVIPYRQLIDWICFEGRSQIARFDKWKRTEKSKTKPATPHSRPNRVRVEKFLRHLRMDFDADEIPTYVIQIVQWLAGHRKKPPL